MKCSHCFHDIGDHESYGNEGACEECVVLIGRFKYASPGGNDEPCNRSQLSILIDIVRTMREG